MDASRGDSARPLAAIFGVAALAWAWLLAGAGMPEMRMDMGGGEVMLMRPDWTPGYAALNLCMWVVMMVAMMLPGAAPALLGRVKAIPFAAGYLAIWTGFSVVATLAEYALDSRGVTSEAMAVRSDALAALLILAAGVYELSPWKQACLRNCVSVAGSESRSAGAFESARLGLRYGAFCLGCCWALMTLLFVAGLMNLLWVALIALWLTAEKLLPWGGRLARVAGVGLTAMGGTWLALLIA
jgi:predicted metal-binding membrane protein